MGWLEVSVTVDGETAEAVFELLNRYGHGGAVAEVPIDCFEHELPAAAQQERVIVKAFLPLDESAGETVQRLKEGLWHLSQIMPVPEPVVRELAEEQWVDAWKRQYHTQRIGQRIVVVPAWEAAEPEPDQVVIRLEPGMAFGTGLHPTTRLCLAALERLVFPGCAVLDVGTGSGILAIAAAKLGAARVLAVDADPVAVGVARENASQNGVSGMVTVEHASVTGGQIPNAFVAQAPPQVVETGQFDVVVINILAHVIVEMAPALAARMAPGASLLAAGLIETQEKDVARALQAQGLEIAGRALEKDWVALEARRAGPRDPLPD